MRKSTIAATMIRAYALVVPRRTLQTTTPRHGQKELQPGVLPPLKPNQGFPQLSPHALWLRCPVIPPLMSLFQYTE